MRTRSDVESPESPTNARANGPAMRTKCVNPQHPTRPDMDGGQTSLLIVVRRRGPSKKATVTGEAL